jgi:AraC family transcriptional regulator, regulatory protein of adaptative response / methylated-DNA-[protein]-cysteine methyltransferase
MFLIQKQQARLLNHQKKYCLIGVRKGMKKKTSKKICSSIDYSCNETCWDALKCRDPKAEGKFFYSVISTRVYCRPTCSARLPRRENVVFHATLTEAKSTGFRPCKRCQPDLLSQQKSYKSKDSTKHKEKPSNNIIRYSVKKSSLGNVLIAATDRGICTISIGETADFLILDLCQSFLKEELKKADVALANWIDYIINFIENPNQEFDLPLDIRGTVFQQKVWQTLRKVPAGNTVSYTEIARQIGNPKAVRAVARACANNALAVVIPCHRVLRLDGALSVYRWGIERKQALLARERLLSGSLSEILNN